jgi:hypothetical protein
MFLMRSIPVVFLCVAALAACDSSDSNSSGGNDAGAQDDAKVVTGDATVEVEEDAAVAVEEDAAVSELDAGELDATVSEDAEVDASVEDTSVPDTSVPDTSVPLTADQMLEAQVTAKMRECAVIAATGDFKANKVVDELDRCLSRCYVAATCASMQGVHCTGLGIAPATSACLDACDPTPADGFHCASGDQIIPQALVCDGVYADCSGNTCKEFGCVDESEEVNCTQTFLCDASKHLLIRYVCDGNADCVDKTDETGCAAACWAE